jgi:hypothetical protein
MSVALALRYLGLFVAALGLIHAVNVAAIGGALGGALADAEGVGRLLGALDPTASALFRGGVLYGFGELIDRRP